MTITGLMVCGAMTSDGRLLHTDHVMSVPDKHQVAFDKMTGERFELEVVFRRQKYIGPRPFGSEVTS